MIPCKNISSEIHRNNQKCYRCGQQDRASDIEAAHGLQDPKIGVFGELGAEIFRRDYPCHDESYGDCGD